MYTTFSYKDIQKDLVVLMADGGEVNQEIQSKFGGLIQESRGWYIVLPSTGIWYLHKCGFIKHGVHADSTEPAFWDSEEEAKIFFDNWKAEVKEIS